MSLAFRLGALVALGLSLSGCLEVIGRPMNREPTAPLVGPCPQRGPEVIGYGCPTPLPR